jgi:hypothetical protein
MSPATHQTVRLARGKHAYPDRGVCVMELASMLAHEPFSDHPDSVCPVIAAFLRTYNDGVDDGRRQDLYRFASEAVGTRAPGGVEEERGRRALQWAEEHYELTRRGLAKLLPRVWPAQSGGGADAGTIAGRVAVKLLACGRPCAHEAALAFVEQLIAYGRPPHIANARVPVRAADASSRERLSSV